MRRYRVVVKEAANPGAIESTFERVGLPAPKSIFQIDGEQQEASGAGGDGDEGGEGAGDGDQGAGEGAAAG